MRGQGGGYTFKVGSIPVQVPSLGWQAINIDRTLTGGANEEDAIWIMCVCVRARAPDCVTVCVRVCGAWC